MSDISDQRKYIERMIGEIANMFREQFDQLKAENAKLREERDGWKKLCTDQEVIHVMREETLDNENTKLRELVRDMHAVISDRNSWWDCMCKDTRRFADRMRELGIEVEQ